MAIGEETIDAESGLAIALGFGVCSCSWINFSWNYQRKSEERGIGLT